MRKIIYAFGTAIFLAMFIFTAATSLTNPFYGMSEAAIAQATTTTTSSSTSGGIICCDPSTDGCVVVADGEGNPRIVVFGTRVTCPE